MRTISKSIAILAIAVLVAGFADAGGDVQQIIDQSFPLSPGGSVSLENVNGDVTIEVWEKDEVRVFGVKTASSQEYLDKLRVEIDASANAVRIETDYPSTRSRDGEEWLKDRDHKMKVEYTLTIPRLAEIDDVDLVNGNLLITGAEGGVTAETVNGEIIVRDASGTFDLSTVNGGVELYADRFSASDSIEMESVNGSLNLYISRSAGAEIRAETLNGKLSNDFGIEVHKGKYVGADFKGSVGGGGTRIDLETVNGAIAVHSW